MKITSGLFYSHEWQGVVIARHVMPSSDHLRKKKTHYLSTST